MTTDLRPPPPLDCNVPIMSGRFWLLFLTDYGLKHPEAGSVLVLSVFTTLVGIVLMMGNTLLGMSVCLMAVMMGVMLVNHFHKSMFPRCLFLFDDRTVWMRVFIEDAIESALPYDPVSGIFVLAFPDRTADDLTHGLYCQRMHEMRSSRPPMPLRPMRPSAD